MTGILQNMHSNILSQEQQELFPLLQQFRDSFGLVGGTAIALHLGHRRSIDFDLFSHTSFNIQNIRTTIRKQWSIDHIFIQGQDELTILVHGVKLTFYRFPFTILFSQEINQIIAMPDLVTLGAMKVFALGKRAKWKDYVDLYFIFHALKYDELIQKATELFGNEFNEKLFRVQLSYFVDVDYSEEVEFMEGFEVSKEDIQKYLTDISLG